MADIQLQEESFKRAEKARLRNKVEERKLRHELDRKHGLRKTHEYRIQMMSEEQRMIEKELDKIKTEKRKPPPQETINNFLPATEDASPKGADKLEGPGRVRGRAMSIHDQIDKYTSSTLPPSYRRASQVMAQAGGASRRTSMVPASQTTSSTSTLPKVTHHPARLTHQRPSFARPQHGHPGESRRTSQAVTWQQEDPEQPSVNDLLQMAMKNAVMYAIKHADKLPMNPGDDDDDDDDDTDDDDDDKSDEEYETTSQYRRAFLVVTKEDDSDDDDGVTLTSRSVRGTQRSEASRKSLYADLQDEDAEVESRSHVRPLSRTSTNLTSVSQISTTARLKKPEMVTPRHTKTLQLPRMNTSSSFDKSPSRKSNPLSLAREPTSSSFVDVHSVVSKTSKASRVSRKNEQTLHLPDIGPRPQARKKDGGRGMGDTLSPSSSRRPRSLHSNASPRSVSSRPTSEVQLPDMARKHR